MTKTQAEINEISDAIITQKINKLAYQDAKDIIDGLLGLMSGICEMTGEYLPDLIATMKDNEASMNPKVKEKLLKAIEFFEHINKEINEQVS